MRRLFSLAVLGGVVVGGWWLWRRMMEPAAPPQWQAMDSPVTQASAVTTPATTSTGCDVVQGCRVDREEDDREEDHCEKVDREEEHGQEVDREEDNREEDDREEDDREEDRPRKSRPPSSRLQIEPVAEGRAA